MDKRIHNKKYLEVYRKELRKNLTSAEAYLWKQLQQRKLDGKKFRRQHNIENYITDFYCPEQRLIIELDGQVHFNPTSQENDKNRTKRLEELGFKVIRFENKMVFDNLQSVLQEIKNNFK